jgi:hypothetical protein
MPAASIQGSSRSRRSPRAPARPIARLGQRRSLRPAPLPGSLCADIDGFSLHAKVRVPAGEKRAARASLPLHRPPIATPRLALSANGRVVYGLKRH